MRVLSAMLHRLRPFRTGARLILGLWGATLPGAAPGSALQGGERGQIRTSFIPLPAEEGVRRIFGLTVDSHGRVLAANGRVWRYDGFSLEELPVPGGAPVGAVAVDAADRVWVGNADQLGYFAPDTAGRAHFTSVREALPAASRDYSLIYAVHCVGDAVYFIAAQAVLEWRGGQFKIYPLPNIRRLFSTTLNNACYVWQRTEQPGEKTITHLWLFTPGQAPAIISSSLVDLCIGAFNNGVGIPHVVTNNGLLAPLTAQPTGWRGTPWDTAVAAVVSLPGGAIAMGSVHDGIRICDDTGTIRQKVDTSDRSLPDGAVEALAVAPDGALWGLTPAGLVRLETDSPVTYWRRAQGWTATVNALARWQDRLHIGTQLGHGFVLTPQADGRPTAWQPFSKFTDSSFVYDLLPSPTAGLVFAGQLGLRSEFPSSAPSPISYDSKETGRSAFHWSKSCDEILYADLNGLMLWQLDQTNREQPWSLVWQEKRSPIDRAYPWAQREFFVTDPSGRIWHYQFTPTSGPPVSLAGTPQLLTPPSGLGRVLRIERHGAWAVAFTRDQAWRWRAGEAAFAPLPTDAPFGIVPATLRLTDGKHGWAVARLNSLVPNDTMIRYGIFRIEFSEGRLDGLSQAPCLVVEDIGWLSSVLSETGVWWLGGTLGLACVELPKAATTVHLTAPPLLLYRQDAGGAFLPLQNPPPLSGARSAVFGYTYPQSAHAFPVAFQTRLAPLEADWSAPTTDRQRTYARLPGGDYTWSVRAVDALGNVSPALNLPLAVAPRLVETFWFRGLALLFIVLGALLAVWGWTRRLRRNQARLEHTVSERTAALLATNEELRAQNQKRTALIGAISHELRTPLTGAYLMAEKLAAAETTGDAEHLRRCLAELRQMLEGTLDLSRYELGLIPVRLRWLRLESIVQETTQLFAPLAAAGGLALDPRLAPAPGLVLADETNLRRVLSNLISNAIKFTPRGRIEVVLAWSRAAPLTLATLTVRDPGQGMSADEVARLFEGFQRVGLRDRGQTASAGLGLSLTKRLVDLAGGDIRCESTPGMGTTFTITLPVLAASADSEPAPPFDADVLIVEDEPGHQAHAVELLEPLGATVTTAGTLAAALELTRTKRFALALVDFNLPDGTGLELWQHWRSAGTLPAHAVVLTSHRSESIREICLAAGFDDVLAKPLSVRTAILLLAANR